MILKKQKKYREIGFGPIVQLATSVNELDFVKHANNYLVLLEGCRSQRGGEGNHALPQI